MNIIGISAFYHDSAACLLVDGEIIAGAQEERFTRRKHDPSFPSNAVEYCLKEGGFSIDEIDAFVFYDKPLLKFERLLETYYAFAPKGLGSFINAMPIWIKEKLFLKRLIREELGKIMPFDKRKIKLLFPEHHLSHAASTYYPSPFEESAILTLDGVGEWATASICHGKGKEISVLKELRFPHSLGLLYSSFTFFLGFRVNSGEYKLMGLAPYGNKGSEQVKEFYNKIKDELVTLHEDGSITLHQKYFAYATGNKMVNVRKWEELFGVKKRNSESELEQVHCNMGLAIQQFTEEVVQKMAEEAKRLTNCNNLCLSGGVALNCVSNGKLQDAGIFENIFITPASGDAGGALGAAYAAEHIYFGNERTPLEGADRLKGSYIGPKNSNEEIEYLIKKYKASATRLDTDEVACQKIASLLNDGHVVGWIQGRMEFGPRALGGRSILGDPRNEEMQKKLNLKIKYRESFRPFAPSVNSEKVSQYFEHGGTSPYMLLVKPVHPTLRNELPGNYAELGLRDKLYYTRSTLPAITHVDFSGRIQSVHKETNPKYWQLINEFEKLSGYACVINTSFNVRGEPIVNSAEDAYRCFMRTEMDYLVVENYLFKKEEQPEWHSTDDWKEEFVLD